MIASESGEHHSPFAFALLMHWPGMLMPRPEEKSDGLITATELYSYVRDQ